MTFSSEWRHGRRLKGLKAVVLRARSTRTTPRCDIRSDQKFRKWKDMFPELQLIFVERHDCSFAKAEPFWLPVVPGRTSPKNLLFPFCLFRERPIVILKGTSTTAHSRHWLVSKSSFDVPTCICRHLEGAVSTARSTFWVCVNNRISRLIEGASKYKTFGYRGQHLTEAAIDSTLLLPLKDSKALKAEWFFFRFVQLSTVNYEHTNLNYPILRWIRLNLQYEVIQSFL